MGDYREMGKRGDYFKRMAAMFCATYSAVTGKSKNNIQSAMDEETYYVGKEITEAGFANNFEAIVPAEGETLAERDSLLVNARMCIDTAKKKAREREDAEDLEKAAALLSTMTDGGGEASAVSGKNTKAAMAATEDTMSPEELKQKYPELYALVFALGEQAALAREKERIAAHLKLGRQAGNLDVAARFIEAGKSVMSDDVQSEYLALRMGKQATDARSQDNPGAMQTGGEGEEDDAKAMASFEAAYNGKNTAFGGK
jgi:hypothetical protein